MAEKPIIFSGSMVEAILGGRKTMTRRVAKPQPLYVTGHGNEERWYQLPGGGSSLNCYDPPCAAGDTLWVREAWRPWRHFDGTVPSNAGPNYSPTRILFRADKKASMGMDEYSDRHRWRPSIHMPRWAARLFLRVLEVHIEQLQDISRGDAIEEGCPFPNMADGPDPRQWFGELWDSLNEKRGFGWAVNPWVWVYRFEVASG